MSQILEIESVVPVVVHYNKQHNIDPTIPPWVVKVKGQTYYVEHFEVSKDVGFSSKETPDNEHTKAALKFRSKLIIDADNCAKLFV